MKKKIRENTCYREYFSCNTVSFRSKLKFLIMSFRKFPSAPSFYKPCSEKVLPKISDASENKKPSTAAVNDGAPVKQGGSTSETFRNLDGITKKKLFSSFSSAALAKKGIVEDEIEIKESTDRKKVLSFLSQTPEGVRPIEPEDYMVMENGFAKVMISKTIQFEMRCPCSASCNERIAFRKYAHVADEGVHRVCPHCDAINACFTSKSQVLKHLETESCRLSRALQALRI